MNWNSKFNPLGNYDDPAPPNDYMPDKPYWFRWIMWFFIRNPLHNFMHYWVGFKGRKHLTCYTGDIWNNKHRLNIVLPFISYKKDNREFYIGWRPDSKAFGFAIRRHKKRGGR
ncbi:hypothetical protein [Thermodesulfovibrio sp.]|uniref:hypothetical protein n=1 Tax=Thermodesulfovibrio sp. TaxID=2067987 RepID=UPI0030B4149A